MIYYRKKLFVSIAEVWYCDNEKSEFKTDIVRYKFVTGYNGRPASFEKLFTILINLLKSKEELFEEIKKNTRYEIKRAQDRDNVRCSTFLEQGELNREKLTVYINFYNTFADSKGRSHIGFSDLEQFFKNKTLCIRYAVKDSSDILTMHAYIISDGTARLHQSSSLFRTSDNSEIRNLISRANRFLHWDDILFFKEMGLRWYDLGGWYGGSTNKEQLAINIFKESFGGELKKEYSYIEPVSLKGHISVFVHSKLEKIKSIIHKA